MTEKRLAGRLVVPENNMAMEPEMNALCPELAPFLVARVVRTLVREDLLAYRGSTLEAVEPFFGREARSGGQWLNVCRISGWTRGQYQLWWKLCAIAWRGGGQHRAGGLRTASRRRSLLATESNDCYYPTWQPTVYIAKSRSR